MLLARCTVAAVVLAAMSGCSRGPLKMPEVVRTEATPAPTPVRQIYVPNQRIDTARLFNDMEINAKVAIEPGTTATKERRNRESYQLKLELQAKVPVASRTLEELADINSELPATLPGLEEMLATAKVSPFFENIYRLKIASLERNLVRLDTLLSRHNFYDCETILEMRHPETKRKVLLIQADMDVDMDGSDSDRVPVIDSSSVHFQPMTSYHWPKKTDVPNPFLQRSRDVLAKLEKDRATKKLTTAQSKELSNAIGAAKYEIGQLKTRSFLVSAVDPYVALPGSVVGQSKSSPFAPALGDYCAVVYGNRIYPAIVGDIGPAAKAGEGSLRLAQALNAQASAVSRPVSDLKVTYLVFPGTADKPFEPPDLALWKRRCEELLNEIGGHAGEMIEWEDLTRKPAPSPSIPSPTPPVETPSVSPSPSVTPEPVPSASPQAWQPVWRYLAGPESFFS
jgi:hypothetical protein